MGLREEFVRLAASQQVPLRELCRRFGISAPTGYKWLRRYAAAGPAGLREQSRRPRHSPARTLPAVEAAVLELWERHRAWGGRKLAARLRAQGQQPVPAPSTITAILRRHGKLGTAGAAPQGAFRRFEAAAPNALWQLDFKGHFATGGARCHPLTLLDDHSRYALALQACGDERTSTVKQALSARFARYGLPDRILVDNGSPWGDTAAHPYTPLSVWWLRLGIAVSHSRPYHPQTLGKDERFHRTLGAELLRWQRFRDLDHCQRAFDRWRQVYNHERPHEALDDAVPASRYQPSPRPFPARLPPIEYGPRDLVRKVQQGGLVSFQGRVLHLPKAFAGYPVGLRPTTVDSRWDIFFCGQQIAEVDLRCPPATAQNV